MRPIPFYAGMYLVNHGENMQERRSALERKLTYISENEVNDEGKVREIELAFAISTTPSRDATIAP